jgi:hypothetical protein
MITRTYASAQNNVIRRRDDHTGPWVDISIPGGPIGPTDWVDIMSDPNDPDRVVTVSSNNYGPGSQTGIMVSYDAGVTWFQPGGSWSQGKEFFEVWWVDSNIIWIVGDQGNVVISTDGGLTFNATAARPLDGLYSYTSCIHALDDKIAVVSGGLTNNPSENDVLVSKTIDGGITWTTLNGNLALVNTVGNPPGGPTGPPEGIWMSPDQSRIIVGTHYNQFLTINSGTSFAAIAPEMTRSGRHLTWYPSYATNPEVFRHIGGPVIQINESLDQGTSWATTRGGVVFEVMRGAHFYTADDGYYTIGGDTYETSDGGLTGNITDSPLVEFVLAVWTGPWPVPPIDPPCGGCPEGFTLNGATGLCEHVDSTPAICDPQNTYTVGPGAQLPGNYSAYGARFYENATGRPLPLTFSSGTAIVDDVAAPLNLLITSTTPAWTDRLNQVGVWVNGTGPTHEWIGFTACVQLTEEKTYYIGIAGDNYVRFSLDGTEIFSATSGHVDTFRNWFMIPITLTAGTHIIELEGLNLGSIAAFGAEIYDATEAALVAMTTPGEIDAVTVFSTQDKIGATFDLGENSGCQCPDGYALSDCNGLLECVRIETAPFNPCPCYLATDCENPGNQVLITLADGATPLDEDLTYIFDFAPDTCFTIEPNDTCDDTTLVITVIESFIDCQTCGGTCYLLTNCETGETIVVDDPAVVPYVGQVIEVVVDPTTTLCLLVSEIPCFDAVVVPLPGALVECYTTCEECLPPPPPPPPMLDIRNRTVKPGYDTKGCPPEYVDKVSCTFAEAMYQEAVSRRYGIEFCCEHVINQNKWAVKKELLDLKMITDPDACREMPLDCCPPCNVEAILRVIETITCPGPFNVDAIMMIPPNNCTQISFHWGGFNPENIQYTNCAGQVIDITLSGNVPEVIDCVDTSQPIIAPPSTIQTVLGSCS